MITYPNADWIKLFAANQSGTTVTAPVPTRTIPSGDGVYSVGTNAYRRGVLVAFFGTNAANETFIARITGWKRQFGTLDPLWIPIPILLMDGILGTMSGAASTDINGSQLFADTITVQAEGDYTTDFEIQPGAGGATPDNTIAIVKLKEVVGYTFIQVQVAKNTCDDVNAIITSF